MNKVYKKFSFDEANEDNTIFVSPEQQYCDATGLGFDFGTSYSTPLSDSLPSSPFYFSVRLPKGNYDINTILGSRNSDGNTSIKAETRTLILNNINTEAGALREHCFSINIKSHEIHDERKFKIEKQESLRLHWDNKSTFEVGGSNPCLHSIEIKECERCKVFF